MEALKEIKEVKQQRLIEYKKYRPGAEYHEGKGVWSIKCDIALPCAAQNELGLEDAKVLTIHYMTTLKKCPVYCSLSTDFKYNFIK